MSSITGLGSLSQLPNILQDVNSGKILIVTGKNSFQACGASSHFPTILQGRAAVYFRDFDINPKIEDAIRGAEFAVEHGITAIVAIGGGSVIDIAKLIKALFNRSSSAEEIITGSLPVLDPGLPLIAIPTTAGSGSEATHFAVAYIGKEKYSIADQCLLPVHHILDGSLTLSASPEQRASNVLDAISQAIESVWAVGATDLSRKFALEALRLGLKSFRPYVLEKENLHSAQLMLEAAHLSGIAINISKTTSAHAWSYGISNRYGVPHGVAVWYTLPKIFKVHAERTLGYRDADGHRLYSVISDLKHVLGMKTSTDILEYFQALLSSIGVSADLTMDLGLSHQERIEISQAVNKSRMANNPVEFTQAEINWIFNL